YTGPETGPDLDLEPTVFLTSSARTPLRIESRLVQAHDTIHMTGADAATAFGGFTLRVEVAQFFDRPYLRVASDLFTPAALAQLPLHHIREELLAHGSAAVPLGDLFPQQNSVEWGAGIDYLWNGWQPILQVNQFVLLDRAPRLLLNDPETRLTGIVRK